MSVEPPILETPEIQDRSLSEPRDPECAVTVFHQESHTITQSLRLQPLSPMEAEAEAESRSLELPSLCQAGEGGRRTGQSGTEVEKKIKFCNPDDDLSPQFECSPRAGRKVKSKSSTLSLHTLAREEEEDDSPQLQRRNSIHNVPFVDVNDPETRTRMERYKEERRSMLRAKYKAEDYLSTSYSRKKKVSTTSSQDSTETPPSPSPSVTREDTKEIQKEETPPPSPPILRVETSLPPPLAISSATLSVSRKLVDLRQPEHTTFISRKSLPDNFNSTNTFAEKHQTPKKWSMGSHSGFIPTNSPQKPRPSELTFSVSGPFQTRTVVLDQGELMNRKNQVFKVNSAEIANMTDNKINTDEIEDNVNVRERATIFGPRKVAESKMRTVSVSATMASVTPVSKTRKFSEGHNPTSPSKIRNMAAMFEQKH